MPLPFADIFLVFCENIKKSCRFHYGYHRKCEMCDKLITDIEHVFINEHEIMVVYSIKERLLRQKPMLIRQIILKEVCKKKRPPLVVLLNLRILFLVHHQMSDSNLKAIITMTMMMTLITLFTGSSKV